MFFCKIFDVYATLAKPICIIKGLYIFMRHPGHKGMGLIIDRRDRIHDPTVAHALVDGVKL